MVTPEWHPTTAQMPNPKGLSAGAAFGMMVTLTNAVMLGKS